MNSPDSQYFNLSKGKVSRTGLICLAMVLAVHVLLLGCFGFGLNQEMKIGLSVPMTGMLVSESTSAGKYASVNGKEVSVSSRKQVNNAEKPENKKELFPLGEMNAQSSTLTVKKTENQSVSPLKNAVSHAGAMNGLVQSGVMNHSVEGKGIDRDKDRGIQPSSAGGDDINSKGIFTEPYSDARFYRNPKPSYPVVSRRMAEEGDVLLSVYILANGKVGKVKLKRSSGFARLDESALQTVKHWQYVPARQNGKAIPFWYAQPIRFSLND